MSGPNSGGGLELAPFLPAEAADGTAEKQTPTFLERLRNKSRVAMLAAGFFSLWGVMEAKPAHAGGGYPWDNAKQLSGVEYGWWIDENGNRRYDGGEDSDPYSYAYRNCTSYAAWLQAKYGVKVPEYLGNANQWDENAPAHGFAVDSKPRNGDVVGWNDGKYGHLAVVKKTNPDGTVNISQYNKSGRGEYSEVKSVRGGFYIHFMNDVQRAQYEADYGLAGGSTGLALPRVEAVKQADFNGDGYSDIWLSSKRGDPAQNEQVQLGKNWLGALSLWGAPPWEKIPFNRAINLAGDVTGDGKADLITITPNSDGIHPNIWLQRSTGSSFGSPDLVGVPSLNHKDTRWAIGDYTGDGRIDLGAFSKRGDSGINFTVFPSTGNWLGSGQFWGNTGAEIPFTSSQLLPGDKYGQGRDGLYALAPNPSDPNHVNIYFLGSTGRNFAAAALTAVMGYRFENTQALAGKFDRNNTTDLMLATERSDAAPNLQVLTSDGGNSYKSVGLWSAPGELRRNEAIYLPADLNKDGLTDVIGIQPRGSDTEEWWLKSTGSSFERPVLVGVPAGNMNDNRYGR